MWRIKALEAIYPLLEDRIAVTNMGTVAVELYSLGHRESFFYLEHSVGLASSVGLGLALCLPEQPIVVVDGDGSVLMNLGGLSTLARYRPPNLVHLIFDNESILSVGGFPTATSTGTNLAHVARGSGVEHAETAGTLGGQTRLLPGHGAVRRVGSRGQGGGRGAAGLRHGRRSPGEPVQFERYIKGLRSR